MDLNDLTSDDQYMFAPYCPRHGSHVLLGYESVIAVEQTPTGPKILLHCHCGELLVQPQTRMPAAPDPVNVDGRACLSPGRSR
jgi:hypothetical protein